MWGTILKLPSSPSHPSTAPLILTDQRGGVRSGQERLTSSERSGRLPPAVLISQLALCLPDFALPEARPAYPSPNSPVLLGASDRAILRPSSHLLPSRRIPPSSRLTSSLLYTVSVIVAPSCASFPRGPPPCVDLQIGLAGISIPGKSTFFVNRSSPITTHTHPSAASRPSPVPSVIWTFIIIQFY